MLTPTSLKAVFPFSFSSSGESCTAAAAAAAFCFFFLLRDEDIPVEIINELAKVFTTSMDFTPSLRGRKGK